MDQGNNTSNNKGPDPAGGAAIPRYTAPKEVKYRHPEKAKKAHADTIACRAAQTQACEDRRLKQKQFGANRILKDYSQKGQNGIYYINEDCFGC